MSDNRTTEQTATEQLRALLDERGVEYETDDRNGLRETIWCGTAAFQLSPTAKMTMIVTPEQAVAATLGSGTLTAEQVREAIERNFGKVAVLDDGGPVEWRDDWVCKVGINYKAIADELNARAERTCEIESSFLNDFSSEHECWWEFDLSCGHHVIGDMMDAPNYCEVCGARVVA